MRKSTVYFVSAPCGTGKTYAACQTIAKNRYLTNHIYVAPTLDLIEETKKTLLSMGVKATVITNKTNPGHVKKAIIEFMKDSFDLGAVLLITWNAYVELPYLNRRDNWEVFIDEVPQLDRFYSWKLPRHLDFLTDYIDIDEETVNEQVAKIVLKDGDEVESRLKKKARDDGDELFRPFFRDLLSPNKDMFVDIESWNRLVENQDFSDHDESNRLYFVSLLRPEPFEDAILLGANIEDSLLCRWLIRFHGCRFERHSKLTQSLRPSNPKLASRLKISYLLPGRHPSKALYKKTVSNETPLIDAMDGLALETFGDDPFLYVPNNGRKSFLKYRPNVVSIPVVAHGLNTYDQYRNIYFSAALNREPKHFEMLKSLGLHPDEVHQASAHETIYQGVMRTSLRDPTSSETVHAIVPDEFSAQRLATLVGTKQINQLGSLYSGPPPGLTKSQRNHRYESKKSLDLIYATKSGHNWYNQERPGFGTFHPRNQIRWFVIFHKDPRANQLSEHHVSEVSIPDFVALLRQQARVIVDTKTDSFLFNPCLFDPPENAPGYRRKDYFRQSSFLVLDFDDGNLSPEDFERIFWHEAGRGQKRSFVICNSFSRAPDKPNKFRAIMFYKRPATSLLEHEAVFEAVVTRLRDHGFTSQSAKLDPSCRSGVQSFYLPCTNRNQLSVSWGLDRRRKWELM